MKRLLLFPFYWCLALSAGTNAPEVSQSTAVPENGTSLVREALEHNSEIRFFEAELQAAKANRKIAAQFQQPELSGSVGQKRSTDPAGSTLGDGVAWSVGLAQTFEWPGRMGLRKAIANQDVNLAELGLERFRTALGSSVRKQAHALASARQRAQVAREVADRLQALREVLIQRDPAGITPQLEIRVIEATELSLRRRATDAQLAAENARLALNLFIGRQPDRALVIVDSDVLPGDLPPLADLASAAQTNNFELHLRTAELEQQGFKVRLAQNEKWPAFTVGPQYTEENAGGQDRIIGVGISFPLPLWRNNSAHVDAAKARQMQAQSILDTAQREISRKIAAALIAYETRRQEIAHWRSDSVKQFADAAELADRHYRLGAVPATTYIELQKQYLEAVETLLEGQREAIAAAAELEELTGLHFLATP
ncbi:MAG TPA: TolC family protein [Candidatus Limnocylindria bacterium]|nr:TolC family protein [Candidatus Limnocylindria bacterium]